MQRHTLAPAWFSRVSTFSIVVWVTFFSEVIFISLLDNDHCRIILCCCNAVNIANSHPATIEEPRHGFIQLFQPHPGDMDLVTCASARLRAECFAVQQYQPSEQYCPFHLGYHCVRDSNPIEHRAFDKYSWSSRLPNYAGGSSYPYPVYLTLLTIASKSFRKDRSS